MNCRHCGSKNRVREHDENETPVCDNCGKPLSNRCLVIGIVGCYQNGKSTLVNCLLDNKVAMTGSGKATTKLSNETICPETKPTLAHSQGDQY